MFKFDSVDAHNEKAWDLSVQMFNRFTLPIEQLEVEKAQKGEFELFLTPNRPIPKSWYENLKGKNVLVLAGGGGRQGPLMALAGANITVVDISKKQLERDQILNEKLNLNMTLLHQSVEHLENIESMSMNLIINPLSNCFFEKLDDVWKSCQRILKKDGELLYAFNNPIAYLFDFEKANQGNFQMKYSSPYSDIESLCESEKKLYLSNEGPLEFGHTLTDQMGLLLKQGFSIVDLFETTWDYDDPLNKYFPQFINIRAKKL